MKMTIKSARRPALIAIGSFACLLFLFLISGYPEGYCPIYPSIDTHFAPNFSDADFDKIEIGMSQAQLDALMCEPLDVWILESNRVQYWYTRDGAAPIGDFAWLARYVTLVNGQVVQIGKDIHHD